MTDCTAVTIGHEGSDGKYPCFRKADVNLRECDHVGTGYDTYIKSEWYVAKGFNCYGSRDGNPAHGAEDLENPVYASCGTMSLDECK